MGRVEAAARVVRREGAAPARTRCCPVPPPRLYHLQRALSWMPLARPGPEQSWSLVMPERHFPPRDSTALPAGCFPTFNWGYKRHLSQYKKINQQVGGPSARWSPDREEQEEDDGGGGGG